MEKDYIKEAYNALKNDKKLDDLVKSFEENKNRNNGMFGYLLGFEKAMQLGDEANLLGNETLKSIDRDVILTIVGNIIPLNECLKKHNDNYIKYKIIENVAILAKYFQDMMSEGEIQ